MTNYILKFNDFSFLLVVGFFIKRRYRLDIRSLPAVIRYSRKTISSKSDMIKRTYKALIGKPPNF